MAALIGRHINKLDKKGRVSVPKPFRDAFALQDFAGIYVFPSFKFPALEACGEDFIQRIIDSLDDLDLFSDEQDDLASTILENSHPLAFDPEGRVSLPKAMLDHANLSAEIAFVGRGTRFQMWEPGAYEVHNVAAVARARTRGATLPLRSPRSGGEGEGG